MKCTECGKKIKFLNAGYAKEEERGKAPCLFYDPDTGKSRPVCKPCFVAQGGTEPIDYDD